jgi:hypothetical protein
MAARIATSPARCAQEDPPPSGSAHDEKGCVKFTLDLLLPNTTRQPPRAHLQIRHPSSGAAPLGRPAPTGHRHCFGTLHSQLGSASIATVGSPGRLSPRDHTLYTGPAVKTCPRRRTTPPGPTGPLTGPAVGEPQPPLTHTPRYPSSHAASHARCSRAPHATQRAHTGPSRSRPSIELQVQLDSWTATQLQTLSPSAPRRERQVARQHHGASGR